MIWERERERNTHTHRQTQQRNKLNIEQNSIRYLADLLSCMNTTAYPSVYKLRYSLNLLSAFYLQAILILMSGTQIC